MFKPAGIKVILIKATTVRHALSSDVAVRFHEAEHAEVLPIAAQIAVRSNMPA